MTRRNRRGQYSKCRKGVTRFEKYFFMSAVAMMVFGLVFDIVNKESVLIPVVEAEEIEPVAEVVLIRVAYNWTKERIEQEVMAVFPDAPVMLKVVACESDYKIDAYNPTNNSHDQGLLQISDRYHKKEWTRLGFTDMKDPIQNLAYGRILYDKNGLTDWRWSKHCWNT